MPPHDDDRTGPSPAARVGLLATTLVVAATLRGFRLGRASFWYDEVVTMRLARTPGPRPLVELLGRIDATRAPLHPLLLQAWVKAFGASEASGRALSASCGVLTVWLVYRIGRRAFDARTGLWAAWLAALSPMLVLYSREARMYAWLVFVTCGAWDVFIRPGKPLSLQRLFVYAACLATLGYSHPLGLVMGATLGLASLLNRRTLGLSWGRWLAPHLAAAVAVAPRVGRYLDHGPEWTPGRQPLKALLGLPIGFIGGNFITLAGFAALILLGLLRVETRGGVRRRLAVENPGGSSLLLIWLCAPPLFLYAYSVVSHPIFGPSRYTLFVAPAYLLLVARGLSKLPGPTALAVGLVASGLSASMWPGLVFAPDLKADWRSAASALDRLDPSGREPLVVIATGGSPNVEVETARYYLGARRPVLPMPDRPEGVAGLTGGRTVRVWFSVGVRDGRVQGRLPEGLPAGARPLDFDGLRLIPVEPGRLPAGARGRQPPSSIVQRVGSMASAQRR